VKACHIGSYNSVYNYIGNIGSSLISSLFSKVVKTDSSLKKREGTLND